MHLLNRSVIDRRTLLRGLGVAVALPWLDAMTRVSYAANPPAAKKVPGRAVFTMWGLGLNGRDFTPKEDGAGWKATPILQPLDRLRDEFTIISGLRLTHSGGHGGDRTYLTGISTHEATAKLRVSADQELAEVIGSDTRFRSLVLGINRGTGFGSGTVDKTLAWTRTGTPIPAENRPNELFDRLFRPESAETIAARKKTQARTASVLDEVNEEAKGLGKHLGVNDQRKLDEYFTAVRAVERSMADDLAWLDKPKPTVDAPDFGQQLQALDPERNAKAGFDYRRYQRLMYDVITLALQTDSTRVINYYARRDLNDGTYCYANMGCPYGYHEMTHHGEDPDKLKWQTKVDTWYLEDWAYFIDRLRSVREGERTLLDNTLLVWGSSGGAINAHNNTNLPTMLFGGRGLGIRHQGHLRKQDVRLGNLWQSMFQCLRVPVPADFQGGEADGVISEVLS